MLAIDNEPRVLDGMRALLQQMGLPRRHRRRPEGRAAALASLGASPDVIIADYHLDEGDGLAAIAALRERLGYHTPAILATADRSPEVREAAAARRGRAAQQAAEAGATARAADALPGAARGGGVARYQPSERLALLEQARELVFLRRDQVVAAVLVVAPERAVSCSTRSRKLARTSAMASSNSASVSVPGMCDAFLEISAWAGEDAILARSRVGPRSLWAGVQIWPLRALL